MIISKIIAYKTLILYFELRFLIIYLFKDFKQYIIVVLCLVTFKACQIYMSGLSMPRMQGRSHLLVRVCTCTPWDCKISTTYLSLFAPAHPGKFILHQHAVSLGDFALIQLFFSHLLTHKEVLWQIFPLVFCQHTSFYFLKSV